jgi:hypothetical protein
MATDIVLDDVDGNHVTIKGFRLNVVAPDLVLDSPDRRTRISPTSPVRRALVHDQNDGLTVNYDGDYSGGIKLCGQVTVVDSIKVNGEIQFDVMRQGEPGPHHIGFPRMETVELKAYLTELMNGVSSNIRDLYTEINNLKARVAALEGR